METLFQPSQEKEEALEMLHNEFLELAVHDLDAPLRKLMLLTERLDEKSRELSVPDDLHPYLERIRHCADGMRSLIDDLHMLTNIRLSNPEFSLCNLEDVVQDAFHQLQPAVNETKAILNVSPALPMLGGNRQLLTTMFKNLLLNSIRFVEKDMVPEITIRSSLLSAEQKRSLQLLPDKLYHRIEVTDNGIGFKEEDAHKIFQPFVSLHGKSKNNGNGMGLAICRKIIDLHEGMLYAEVKDGKGAAFIVIIPQTH